MKNVHAFLLALLSSSAAAQSLLSSGNGQLPACGSTCAVLTGASSSCGSSWACFCGKVWDNSGGALTTMCDTACANPADNAAVVAWYTANCGSDNGASEHPGSGGGGGGGSPSASASGSAASSSASSGAGEATASTGSDCSGSWWHCHYKWIIMLIVLAIGLCALGFGGRWLKKRHDRKRDQIRNGFNAGITSRSAVVHDDKADPASSGFESGEGIESPPRTREGYNPYGYGYRGEIRDGTVRDSPPITRGGTPFEEMEKGDEPMNYQDPGVKGKMRRVLVRERSLK